MQFVLRLSVNSLHEDAKGELINQMFSDVQTSEMDFNEKIWYRR
ncbi:hypothetical protein [Hungatella hathewayi]